MWAASSVVMPIVVLLIVVAVIVGLVAGGVLQGRAARVGAEAPSRRCRPSSSSCRSAAGFGLTPMLYSAL